MRCAALYAQERYQKWSGDTSMLLSRKHSATSPAKLAIRSSSWA